MKNMKAKKPAAAKKSAAKKVPFGARGAKAIVTGGGGKAGMVAR